jgi:rhamnose transport system substrate-binding protein
MKTQTRVAGVAALLMLVTACSTTPPGASSTTAAAAASGSSAASSAAGGAGCATGPVSVTFINKLDTDPYWGETEKGANDAKAALGGDLTVTAPSKDTGDAQVEFINNAIAKKTGAIVIAGNNPDTVAPALKRARDAGIPVLSYDSDVATDSRSLFINQADLSSVGTMLLDAMADQLGGTGGDVAVMIDNATATNQVQWVDSMKKAIAENPKYSNLNLVTTVYGQSSEATSQQQALALVQAYPDLKGMIIPSGLSFPAATRALETSGDLDRIKVNGLAPVSIMKKYLENKQVVNVWWNVHDLGYLAYSAAQALAQCKVQPTEGASFDAGDLGSFTVGTDGEVLLGPAKLVDDTNIGDFAF